MTAPMIPMMRSPITPPGPSPGTTFLASHPAMIPTIIHERILISLIPPSELTDPWLLPVYRKKRACVWDGNQFETTGQVITGTLPVTAYVVRTQGDDVLIDLS